jgi:hypothetical protein
MSDPISSPLVPQDLPIIQTTKHAVVDTVVKPLDLMASPKSSNGSSRVARSPPDSLRRLMTSGSQKSGRTPFTVDFDRLKKNLENKKLSDEALDLYGYGYGCGADEDANAAQNDKGAKRRKFQRRNSKTPAMLMAMNSPLLFHLDFLEDKKEHEQSAASAASATSELPKTFEFTASNTFDSWDTGIEIAEDLVMHLQKRKRASQP